MKSIFTLLALVSSVIVFSQTAQVVTPLSSSLSEASGLIYLNGKIVTHNDSDGEAVLYEIDTLTGNYSRKVIVENANNTDWEDMTVDKDYIYIGDFGNDEGSRTNLKIYRVLISEYLNAINDTVQADQIEFSYADQIAFNTGSFSSNYDAESLIAYGDSLYIFTKNWGDFQTNIYPVSKIPGTYTLTRIDSLDVQGLVTGATFDSVSQVLMLCGYQTSAFTYKVNGFLPPFFSSGNTLKTTLLLQNSFQVEGITTIGDYYYLSAEQNLLGAASLYRFGSITNLTVDEGLKLGKTTVYPNPFYDQINISTEALNYQVLIYDLAGKLVMKSSESRIDCSGLESGVYMMKIFNSISNVQVMNHKIIKV